MDLFKKYGEVKRVFNLIDKRGMAFITYYDIRDAQEAKRDLQGYDFEGRPLDIHYSIPRDDDDQAKNEENNVSTVFARLRGGTGPLRDKPPMTNREVKRLFEEWGSVKEVRECRGKPFQKFVEFYDIRHSEKCLKEAAETHKSTILDVQPAHAKREGRRDDDRDRDRPRPTGWGGGGGYNSGGGGGYDDRSRRPGDDYRFAGGRTGGSAPYSGSVSPYGGYGVATPSASTLPAYGHTSSSSSYITPQPSHQPYSTPSTAALPAGLAHQDASQGVAGGDVGATLQTLLSLVQLFNQPQPAASPAPAQGYAPPQHAPQPAQASYHLQSLASPYSQQQQQQPPPPGATSYYQPQPTGAPAALAQGYSTSSSSAAAPQQYQQPQQQQQRYGM